MPPKPTRGGEPPLTAQAAGGDSPAIIVTSIDVNHYAQLANPPPQETANAQTSAEQQQDQRQQHAARRAHSPGSSRRPPVSPAVTASHSGSSSSSSSSALVALPASATDAAASSLPSAPPVPVESVSRRAIKEATGGLGGSIFSACCVYVSDRRTRTRCAGAVETLRTDEPCACSPSPPSSLVCVC